MTGPGSSVRRSGDPRKRAVQAPPPDAGTPARVVAAVLVMAVGLGATLLLALRPHDGPVDDEARGHARAACDLTEKAGEAASVDTAARYAAAALLLDQAIIESGRAADAATEFTELDQAMLAVHTAAHQGSPGPWQDALDTALAACGEELG